MTGPRIAPEALGLGDPAVAAIFDALDVPERRPAGSPRFVGGCVRDALLGRPAADLDLATPLPPAVATAALRAAGIRVVPTGLDHGTVTAVLGERAIEVTTLRVDLETDGRRARVSYTDDWRADAARRDFTMNALSAGRDGVVHDYFGGVADARAGRVRFIGDARRRIEEDALRILRFFRFHARFGAGAPDAEALAACAEKRGMIAGLSGERIRTELLKLLAAEDPLPAWTAMADAGVEAAALGVTGDRARLAAIVALDRAAARIAAVGQPLSDPLLRLAALLVPRVEGAIARLKVSRAERERLRALAAAPPRPEEAHAGPAALRQRIYRVVRRSGESAGRRLAADRLLLAAAACVDDAQVRPEEMEALTRRLVAGLELVRGWAVPPLPVGGRDATALGLIGPAVGAVLAEVETWWAEHDFAPGREACLERLAAIVKARGVPG